MGIEPRTFHDLSWLCDHTMWFPSKTHISPLLTIVSPVAQWLSPGQTDWQVVASSHKLNLRRDLRWVANRTHKFPCARK